MAKKEHLVILGGAAALSADLPTAAYNLVFHNKGNRFAYAKEVAKAHPVAVGVTLYSGWKVFGSKIRKAMKGII